LKFERKMKFSLFILGALLTVAFSHKVAHPAKVELIKIEKNFNEIISVDLKKANEDIKFVALVRIHLIDGHVHINGHPLLHNQVHDIKMMVKIIDIIKGVRQAPKRKSVQVRILVEETNTNGVPKLHVEEEFTAIEGETVEQVDVHQIIWESNIRRPITIVKLVESKIHTHPRKQDHQMLISDEVSRPHLPNHGYGFDGEDYEQEHKRHGKKHHHCHKGHHGHGHHRNGTFSDRMHQAKCWYKSLSWKSKILLFSVGFFGLLTAVICCGMCCKRRKARKVILQMTPPMDDNNVEKEKSGGEKKDGEFHFEFDNTITIDDKKPLIEEA